MKWREEEKVDDILSNFTFEERDAIQEVYPHGYHMCDKQGRPIYIECVGVMDITKVMAISTEERMVRHYI